MARPRTNPISHKDICTAVAKISAYLRTSNIEKAREWAELLVEYLTTLSLYPTHTKTGYKKEVKNSAQRGT